MSLDPRTRDAIRAVPKELKELRQAVDELSVLTESIYKLTRSTNESVVRKYGGGKKNTAKKVAEAVSDKVRGE